MWKLVARSMRRACNPGTLAVLLILELASHPDRCEAGWPTSPDSAVTFGTATDPAVDGVIASDGQDGLLLTYSAFSNGLPVQLVSHRFSPDGSRLWGESGIAFGATPPRPWFPTLCTDNRGGAWVCYSAGTPHQAQRIQRVSSLGAVALADTGLVIGPPPLGNPLAALCPDGGGGVLVAWMAGVTPNDFPLAQWVDRDGIPRWGAGGALLGSGTQVFSSDFRRPTAIAALSGSRACAIWYDVFANGGPRVRAQILDSLGMRQLVPEGALVSGTDIFDEDLPGTVMDGAGHVIVGWQNDHLAGHPMTLQRIGPAGELAWGLEGRPVGEGQSSRDRPAIASDGLGGVLLCWISNSLSGKRVNATRIGPDGLTVWVAGAPLGPAHYVLDPAVIGDATGGAIVGWIESNASPSALQPIAVRLQRLDALGVPQWGDSGVVAIRYFDEFDRGLTQLVPDGAGGAYVRACRLKTRLAHVNRLGQLGGDRLAAAPGVPVLVPPAPLRLSVQNPARGAVRLTISQAIAGPVELMLLDVSGRCRLRVDLGAHAAGAWQHTLTFDRAAQEPLPPGLYLATLRQASARATAKFVRVN